jgi:hypothetical protein
MEPRRNYGARLAERRKVSTGDDAAMILRTGLNAHFGHEFDLSDGDSSGTRVANLQKTNPRLRGF